MNIRRMSSGSSRHVVRGGGSRCADSPGGGGLRPQHLTDEVSPALESLGVSTADITWLNTAETARRLGVTPRTLYRFIDEGQLPAYRFGRVIRLKEDEVAEFIERCRIAPGTLDITSSAPAHDLTDGSRPTVGK